MATRSTEAPPPSVAPEISIDSAQEFASLVTEQTTGGKIWDAAVMLLEFLEAQPERLGGRPTVIELGAGTGWLGMTLASRRDLSAMVLTEMVQGGALSWLDRNVQRNRDAGVPLASVRTAPLDWSWIVDEPTSAAADLAAAERPAAFAELLDTHWDVVLGSDLVYNEAGVQML